VTRGNDGKFREKRTMSRDFRANGSHGTRCAGERRNYSGTIVARSVYVHVEGKQIGMKKNRSIEM